MHPSKNIPRISISITNKPSYALDLQRGPRPASSLTPKIQIYTTRNKISVNNSYRVNKREQKKQQNEQLDRSHQDRSALTARNENGSREPIERENSISKLKNYANTSSKLVALNKLKPCSKPNYLNKSKEDNCTLKIINQKLRELKLSESIEPIVQPYRDRSSENYGPTPRQSNSKYDNNKQMLASIGGIARSTFTEDASLSFTIDNSKNSQHNPIYPNIPHLKLNLADELTRQKKSPTGLIEEQPQNLQQSSQEFSFECKKRQEMERQIQIEKQLIQRREKQILLRQKQLQAELSKQLERNKQILKQKQNKRASVPFAQIRQKFYENEMNSMTVANTPQPKIETEAQKCARITFIYEPFSMNLSSNYKSKELPSPHTQVLSAESNLNKNGQSEEKIKGKKAVQLIKIEPEQFQGEDKWDKIVRERQKIYNKDTNLSPFVKHYYNQNQESNDFTNMKVKNQLISAASTDIKHAPESLYGINTRNDYFLNPSKELQQKEQSRTYSNSYVKSIQNEQSCQYSFVENGSPLRKQQIPQYQEPIHRKQEEGEKDENITGLHEKIQMIASYYNKKKQEDKSMEIKNSEKQRVKDGLSGRIKYSTPKIDPYIEKNLNLSLQQNKMKNMQDMKYSYSFSEQKEVQYRQQKELFSKLLHCTHIQWMIYFTSMVNVVQNYGIDDGIQDGQDSSMLITYVKIGENGQNIYENRIIAHYIGIWLLSMGYDDPQVKHRVISNVQLMFMDIDDIIAQDSGNKQSQEVSHDMNDTQEFKDDNVKNIVELMFNNLLHGYLPTNLQIAALLEVCRRGWQYFTFLIFRILKVLINENKKKQKRLSINLDEGDIQFISDQELYTKLEKAISSL